MTAYVYGPPVNEKPHLLGTAILKDVGEVAFTGSVPEEAQQFIGRLLGRPVRHAESGKTLMPGDPDYLFQVSLRLGAAKVALFDHRL